MEKLLTVSVLLALTSTSLAQTSSAPVETTVASVVDDSNSTDVKDGKGAGHGYGGYGDDYYGHRRHHHYEPVFDNRPYYDTHYCSVHGSFALSYTETAPGDYNHGNGYNAPPPKKNRKFIREYCRFAAAQSDKACRFCCQVVARSAYTNKDDIISAIFAFDPANPSAGGAGLPVGHGYGHGGYGYEHHHYGPPHHGPSYGGHHNGGHHHGDYNNGGNGGYGNNNYGGNNNGYGNNNGGYGGNNNGYGNNQGGYGGGQPGGYGPQGPGGYRQKRSDTPASAPAPPPENWQVDPSNPIVPGGSFNPINQCVCCAPKHK